MSPSAPSMIPFYALIVPTFEPKHPPSGSGSSVVKMDRGNRLISQGQSSYEPYEEAGGEPRLESISLTPRNVPSLKSMTRALIPGHQAASRREDEDEDEEVMGCLVEVSLGVLVEKIHLKGSPMASFSPSDGKIIAINSPSPLPSLLLLDASNGRELGRLIADSSCSSNHDLISGGSIRSFSFSPRGLFIAAEVSSSSSSVAAKTSKDGDGAVKVGHQSLKSWLYLWRVEGDSSRYEQKYDLEGNVLPLSLDLPLWRSEEHSHLMPDSYSWSRFFNGWENFHDSPSLSPSFMTYACDEGNVIAILSPPPPPPFPSSDEPDYALSSTHELSADKVIAIASMRWRSSGGHRQRLMGSLSSIIRVYSETKVQAAVVCGSLVLGSGSVAVVDEGEGSDMRRSTLYYDNVHVWLVN